MKLKVCGMREEENILQIASLQPDYMGFIFYEKSPRCVGDEIALTLRTKIPANIQKIGVFVNHTQQDIARYVTAYNLDGIQLHGDESPTECRKIQEVCGNEMIIKAFGMGKEVSWEHIAQYVPYCSHFLFDTKTTAYGGSGKSFDWSILEQYPLAHPFYLSGGIGLHNMDQVWEMVKRLPHLEGIDINSQVEERPGWKSVEMVAKIQKEVKNAVSR